MRVPFVQVMWQGKDLVPVWGPSLLRVSISDEKGLESDKCTIEIDDVDGSTDAPEPGEVVEIIGGYEGEGGVVQGRFEIDTVDEEGWPQKITLSGSSVSAKGGAKVRKTEAHRKTDTPTIGDLARKIATRNGWEPRIAEKLASIPLSYEAQSAESDAAFLQRVLRRYDGNLAVKQGKLVASVAGAGVSVSGGAIGGLIIAPGINLKSYRVSRKKKPEHGKAEASVFDRKKVRRVDVDAGGTGRGGEITFRFREPFKTTEEARRAAEAKLGELSRGERSATFEIEGEPEARAEEPVIAQGIKPGVDGTWNPTRVEHVWADSGFSTSLTCEAPGKKAAP
jgi:phage protein D